MSSLLRSAEDFSQKLIEDFHEACRRGDVMKVRELIDAVPVELRSCYLNFGSGNFSPLSKAAYNGCLEVVQILIAEGAEVNKPDNFGSTPLYRAVECGHLEVVLKLISFGADLRTCNYQESGPLICFAAIKGNLTIVQALIESIPEGAARVSYVNMADRWGNSALKFAASRGHYPVVQLLIRLGANLSQADNRDGQTALHWAAQNGHINIVKALLSAIPEGQGKIDYLKRADFCGETALHVAAFKGHSEVVKVLVETISEGPDRIGYVNMANSRHQGSSTALHLAAQKHHLGAIETLIAMGADVELRDRFGRAALDDASRYGRPEIAQALIRSDVSGFAEALAMGSGSVVEASVASSGAVVASVVYQSAGPSVYVDPVFGSNQPAYFA